MGLFKMCVTQENGEGRLTKKVTKHYVGGGFAAKKCVATHSRKTRDFAIDVLCDADFFCCFFMSVFVDDVISFLLNK